MTVYDLAERVERLHPPFRPKCLMESSPKMTHELGFSVWLLTPFAFTVRMFVFAHVSESVESRDYYLREMRESYDCADLDLTDFARRFAALRDRYTQWRIDTGTLVLFESRPIRDQLIQSMSPWMCAGFVDVP